MQGEFQLEMAAGGGFERAINCDFTVWAEDARAYNELITSWEGIEAGARDAGIVRVQAPLDI